MKFELDTSFCVRPQSVFTLLWTLRHRPEDFVGFLHGASLGLDILFCGVCGGSCRSRNESRRPRFVHNVGKTNICSLLYCERRSRTCYTREEVDHKLLSVEKPGRAVWERPIHNPGSSVDYSSCCRANYGVELLNPGLRLSSCPK
jgi:hypothetical protein